MNPYAFFVGCPRSGTTLVGRIADAHPDLAVIHETRWIPDWFERQTGLSPDGYITPELIDRLREHGKLTTLGLDQGALERLAADDGPVAYADFVAALFDLYGAERGKPLVGDKSPGYVRFLPTLHKLWPEAKFVHIIRDGRDVCLSVLDWRKGATRFSTFDDDPYPTIGAWWEWYVELGRETGRTLAPRLYHELRYEALVADPEYEVARLCEFLGIPYADAMLRFHEGRTRSKPGLSAKSAWLPVTSGLRDWRTTMNPDDLVRFEASAGHLLDELGYPRAATAVPDRTLADVARLRTTFAEEVRARRRPLPQTWRTTDAISTEAVPGRS